LSEFISRWTIRSKCDRDPGFFARDSLGRKAMAEKGRRLTKMERMIGRERPKK